MLSMLAAKYRLQKDVDIERVLKTKRGVFDTACGIKYAKNALLNSRFTVVAGVKVSKNAVDRNRMKRQYREILRKLLPRITSGYDIMLLIGKPALTLTYEEKEQRLNRVFAKAGLLAPPFAKGGTASALRPATGRTGSTTGNSTNRSVSAHPVARSRAK